MSSKYNKNIDGDGTPLSFTTHTRDTEKDTIPFQST